MLFSCMLFALLAVVSAAILDNGSYSIANSYIIHISKDYVSQFHKQASAIPYSIRHEFLDNDIFPGLSIQVEGDVADTLAQLQEIAGVTSVSNVYNVNVPVQPRPGGLSLRYGSDSLLPVSGQGNLSSPLIMGGVDRVHQLGIKGKGIKIGIIDTGVDYRHPALGGGYGPGRKIVGGHSFVLDNGTLSNSPDPLATCYGGGHGTHVTGIIGMDSFSEAFDITGVAPEASLYMYRVFDCSGHAGSDTIIAAMIKAYEDGVDIVSMSLGIGHASFSGAVDPLAAVTKMLTDHGIAVVVAQANDANGSSTNSELYTAEWPSTEPTAISVGAISNTHFPIIYAAADSVGASLQYASVHPLDFPNGLDVYILDDGCSSESWQDALSTIKNVSQTAIAFAVTGGCPATSAGSWNSAPTHPVYIMAFNSDTTDPYLSQYDTPSQGFFGATQFINLNAHDGSTLRRNYASSGGYLQYRLFFRNKDFTSTLQQSGGMVDYYSSFGPTWHDYDLKPQISAPGGHILSTWPLGPLGGYSVLSGTSMATPYLSGCYALVKSQFPAASIEEIRTKLQVTARPVAWIHNQSMLSATVQQGSGLVNVFDAIFAETTIFPGQLKISDNDKTVYGAANITIQNLSRKAKTYTLSHQGAGFMNYYLAYGERNQVPLYGEAVFKIPRVTIAAGASSTIPFRIMPPRGVIPSSLPVFGGFIWIVDAEGSRFSVPYTGPPYSLYNTPYLLVQNASQGTPLPGVFAYTDDQTDVIYNTTVLEIHPSNGYGASIPTLQWTRSFRVDVLPANTSMTATYYGFDQSVLIQYNMSKTVPEESIFGFPSFGTVFNSTGFTWPGGASPFKLDDIVQRSNGSRQHIGNGDYRWYASVLKEGGSILHQDDYETWLGPVMRLSGL